MFKRPTFSPRVLDGSSQEFLEHVIIQIDDRIERLRDVRWSFQNKQEEAADVACRTTGCDDDLAEEILSDIFNICGDSVQELMNEHQKLTRLQEFVRMKLTSRIKGRRCKVKMEARIKIQQHLECSDVLITDGYQTLLDLRLPQLASNRNCSETLGNDFIEEDDSDEDEEEVKSNGFRNPFSAIPEEDDEGER